MQHRILLVEDEEHLLDIIRFNLELEGYQVVTAEDGKAGVDTFRSGRFDLIILDVMLPVMDGFKVCQTIRLEDAKVPILFLTAKDSGTDRVQGLKIGADDYLTKPFNLEELLLRVEKLILRSDPKPVAVPQVYSFGNCSVNFLTYEIQTVDGEKKTLSKREAMLLKLLIERKSEVVSRTEILETVWGYDVYPSSRTIDNYILSFRKCFETNPKEPVHFHSVRGVGYKFVP